MICQKWKFNFSLFNSYRIHTDGVPMMKICQNISLHEPVRIRESSAEVYTKRSGVSGYQGNDYWRDVLSQCL